jgi:Amt family ammonium transporter
LGTLLAAVFAVESLGGMGLAKGVSMADQFVIQAIGVASVAVLSGVLTYIIAKIVAVTVGLRVSEEEEIDGLDISAHGERGYNLT